MWRVGTNAQETKTEWDVPRVSPYRLAAHLTSAAIIYGTLLWTSLSLAYPTSAAAALSANSAMTAGLNALRRWAHPVAGLIAITALSGALHISQHIHVCWCIQHSNKNHYNGKIKAKRSHVLSCLFSSGRQAVSIRFFKHEEMTSCNNKVFVTYRRVCGGHGCRARVQHVPSHGRAADPGGVLGAAWLAQCV